MSNENEKVIGLSNPKIKGKPNSKIILSIIGIIVLALGIVAGIILVKEQQNIAENAEITCIQECPGADGILRNCTPPSEDGSAQETSCNSDGLIAFCGVRNYCCPTAGGTWTTNTTLCSVIQPTSTPTVIPTIEPTITPTATATGTGLGGGLETPTATPKATPTLLSTETGVPIPVTGNSLPTILGVGVGIIILLTSFIFVL